MRIPFQKLFGVALLLSCAGYALIAADPAPETRLAGTVQEMALPEYDKDGKLLRPTGYEKWVVVGTSIGLGYSDGDRQDADNPGTFHNVYLQPEAFDHYVETGKFPEQTVFIVTNNASQPARTKGPVSRSGFVAAPTSGLEIAIKDTKKYPDGWAYFLFHDKPDTSSPHQATAEHAFAERMLRLPCRTWIHRQCLHAVLFRADRGPRETAGEGCSGKMRLNDSVVEKGIWNSPASGFCRVFCCLQSSRHVFQRDFLLLVVNPGQSNSSPSSAFCCA